MAAQLQPDSPQPEKRGSKLGKWKPKKWRPEYDRIVGYSVMGKSNVWIAQNLGFTPEHVSVILNQPQATELAAKLQSKLRKDIEENIPETLAYVAQKTASRIKEVIDDDELFRRSPFAVVGMGMDILKGIGHLKHGNSGNGGDGGGNGMVVHGTVIIAQGQKTDILEGLEKVAEVKRLHSSSK